MHAKSQQQCVQHGSSPFLCTQACLGLLKSRPQITSVWKVSVTHSCAKISVERVVECFPVASGLVYSSKTCDETSFSELSRPSQRNNFLSTSAPHAVLDMRAAQMKSGHWPFFYRSSKRDSLVTGLTVTETKPPTSLQQFLFALKHVYDLFGDGIHKL